MATAINAAAGGSYQEPNEQKNRSYVKDPHREVNSMTA